MTKLPMITASLLLCLLLALVTVTAMGRFPKLPAADGPVAHPAAVSVVAFSDNEADVITTDPPHDVALASTTP